jgi:hypothetical protein
MGNDLSGEFLGDDLSVLGKLPKARGRGAQEGAAPGGHRRRGGLAKGALPMRWRWRMKFKLVRRTAGTASTCCTWRRAGWAR